MLKKMYVLRRILNPMGTMDAIEFLLDKLRKTKNNGEFFESHEHLIIRAWVRGSRAGESVWLLSPVSSLREHYCF